MTSNAEYQRSRYVKRNNPNYRFHGEATKKEGETSEYIAWKAMKQRCTQPKYKYHYGRGIRICDKWFNNYPAFLADMGRKPTAAHTLERIDNNGNYEPDNCKWATRAEQVTNYRRNRYVIYKNVKYTAKQFSQLVGLTNSQVIYRLNQGKTIEQILEIYGKGKEHAKPHTLTLRPW